MTHAVTYNNGTTRHFRVRAFDDEGRYVLEEEQTDGTWSIIEGASGWTATALMIEEYQNAGHHLEWE